MAIIETVKIASDDTEFGYVIINKEDFKEGEHELFVEGDPVADGESKEETAGPTKAELLKSTKSELLAKAEEAGVKIDSPDDVTKDQIADLILGADSK